LIEDCQRLNIDGSDLKAGKQVVSLPQAVRKAIVANGHSVGMTVTIRKGTIEVLVRAGRLGQLSECKAALPIDNEQRQRLLVRPMAVLSRGGLHFITPHLYVPRPAEPDLLMPAPANRWRNPGDQQLYALYRSAWRLGGNSPASLVLLRNRMLMAAPASPEMQTKALTDFRAGLPRLVEDVRICGAAKDAITDVLVWLESSGKP
jgi:hypothetical protein